MEVILGACSSPGALGAYGPGEGGESVCLLLSEQLPVWSKGLKLPTQRSLPGPSVHLVRQMGRQSQFLPIPLGREVLRRVEIGRKPFL